MAAQKTSARKKSQPKRDKGEDKSTDYEKELAGYLQERIKPGLNQGSIPMLARSIAKEIARRQQETNGASEEPEEQDEPDAEAEVQPTDEVEDDEPTDEVEDEPEDEVEDEPEDEPTDEVEDEPEDEPEDEDEGEPEDEVEDEPEDEVEDEPEDEVEDEPEDEVEDEPEDEVEPEDEDEGEQEPDFEADMRDLQEELGDEWVVTFSVKGEEAWLTAEKTDGSQHVEAQTADVLLEAVELLDEGGGRDG